LSLIDNIKESEGFRSRVYQCTEGYDTIGYGFAIKDLVLSEEISTMILVEKLDKINDRLSSHDWFIDSPDDVRDVLVEMAYQMGVTGLLKFKKTLLYVSNRKYKEASVEMLDSLWAKQTPNRAKKLSDIMYNSG
tara:strand:+ start:2266 stop:2667 length:402 start_codon:yes stop_codon:yes gene_type:complete